VEHSFPGLPALNSAHYYWEDNSSNHSKVVGELLVVELMMSFEVRGQRPPENLLRDAAGFASSLENHLDWVHLPLMTHSVMEPCNDGLGPHEQAAESVMI